MTDNPNISELLEFTTEIVAAHAGNNAVTPDDLPKLIQDVFKTLSGLGTTALAPERPKPAVAVKKSVFPDYIICLEDGKKLKMLKRHLKTAYNMSPKSTVHAGDCQSCPNTFHYSCDSFPLIAHDC